MDPNANLQYQQMMRGMQPNGMVMQNELQKRAIQNNRNAYVHWCPLSELDTPNSLQHELANTSRYLRTEPRSRCNR